LNWRRCAVVQRSRAGEAGAAELLWLSWCRKISIGWGRRAHPIARSIAFLAASLSLTATSNARDGEHVRVRVQLRNSGRVVALANKLTW
jgi:hypothetical protein